MSDGCCSVAAMFESGECGMSVVSVREYDGGRSVEMERTPGFVILETGSQAFAFDEHHFLHQVKRLFGISLIIQQ